MARKKLITNRCSYIANLVKDKTVLDIGCVDHDLNNRKQGKWLHDHLVASAKEVTGLDYEREHIEAMKRDGYKAVAADATDFKLDERYDIIVAGEIIEHIVNAGLFLDCVRKHLNPDGQLIITTPNANCLVYFIENLLLGKEIDNPDHVCIYTPTTIELLLNKKGFELDQLVFLAENTAYCHHQPINKFLVHIKQGIQITLGVLQPSICHHMIVVAKVKSNDSEKTDSAPIHG